MTAARFLEHGLTADRAIQLRRHIPGHKATLGALLAGIISIALFGLALEHTAAAFGAPARHPLHNGLRILTLRVTGAGQKPAEPARLDHHIPATDLANLVGDLLRHLEAHILQCLLCVGQLFAEIRVEIGQNLLPGQFTFFHLIQLLLHTGSEFYVHNVIESLHHQAVDYLTQGCGRQALILLDDVLPVLNGGNDGGVGGRTAHPLLLHGTNQGGLGIPGRGLGEMLVLHGVYPLQRLALGQIRQRGLNFLGFIVFSLFIDGGKAGEFQTLVVGPEHVVAAGGFDGNGIIEGVGHLAGYKAAPNQLIEPVLILGQVAGNSLRVQTHITGADGFVGILGGIFRFELPVRAVVIGCTVTAGDKFLSRLQGVVRQTGGVGTHIGNQTQRTLAGDIDAFIQLLGNGHGAFGGHIQLPGCLLLESRSNEGRRGRALLLGPLDAGHGEAALLQRGHHCLDFLNIFQFPLFGVPIEPGLELAGLAHPLQHHVQRPILLRLKGTDFIFPVHHHAGSHRLDPSGRQATADLLPQQRAQLIAHNAVQNPPGLLGIHQIVINATGRCNGLGDHVFRNFVERYPQCLFVGDVQ